MAVASYWLYFLHAGVPSGRSVLGLPVDPLLGMASSSSPHVQLPLPLGTSPEVISKTAGSSVVITEGIAPISMKLVEKIRQWEFVDLSKLLQNQDSHPEEATIIIDGQLVSVESGTRSQRKATGISDILSWLQAFSRLMAVLLSSDLTSKEEAAGLAAHQHLILQLAKDLGGRQWLKYDWDFREWAAAKNVRVWGDLNMSIYGRCLP